VQLLAHAGDGSLRDALSLLDQLLAYGDGRALEADARVMLGTVEREHVARLAQLLARADGAGLLGYARQLEERSPDYAELLQQLASLLERVALRQLLSDYEGDELHDPQLLGQLAGQMDPEDVQLFYQTAILGRRDLALAPDARTGFRMCLIRMLAFRPPAADARPAAATRADGVLAAPPASAVSRTAEPAGAAVPIAEGAAAPVDGEPATRAVSPGGAAADEWSAIVAQLEQGLPRQLAENCLLLGREGSTVRLALDTRRATLRTATLEDKLAQALGRYFGGPVRLQIEPLQGAPATLARERERTAAARVVQARAQFEADPAVNAFKERFGASVLPDSVQPLEPND
jgi:DNA polymerase-3 subunit gamma/tau